jgi:HEAT repeat protein
VLIRPELVDEVVAGGEEGERALGEILALGEAAIPSVFSRFPGPLVIDRHQMRGELPRPADCGPVLRIVAAMRRLALPFLAVRSADADPEVRFWSTYLLGELHYPDTAAALLPRLFDENAAVRRIAIRSGRALVAGDDEAALPLRRSLERMVAYPDEPANRRLVAIGVVGELRVYRCIPALIAALTDSSRLIVETAAHTLATMTRQEFGTDARKWGDWWETKGRKRLP